MMKLLVDGVFFQLQQSGIARVWRTMLPMMLADGVVDITLLDRGGIPDIGEVKRIPFPTYRDLYTANDSILIQDICDSFSIDVFTSTYYTTPTRTPMALMVYDMIPELFGFDLNHRHWQEKALALSYAQRFVSISDSTRTDLERFYPATAGRSSVAHLGYDTAVFQSRKNAEVASFRATYGLDRAYVVFVGSREQHLGYKNSKLFFQALACLEDIDFDILCIGGEPSISSEISELLPNGVSAKRIVATDDELAIALSGARGLIYPSLYEGFGLPVLEAMACGCPVITTRRGSLREVAGDACQLIDGESVEEMAAAIRELRKPSVQAHLRHAGLRRAKNFNWRTIVDALYRAIEEAAAVGRTQDYRTFSEEWQRLRVLQAEVDVDRWHPAG